MTILVVFFVFLQQIHYFMSLSPSKVNLFLFLKLPSAFWCGVRFRSITKEDSSATVTFRWFNQNPFKSMYFAVQSMAAELTTGALVMNVIKESGQNISMLVVSNNASFQKKAVGTITFTCLDGAPIAAAIQRTIITGEGQLLSMKSIGKDQKGDQVSEFNFEWSIKIKSK